MSYHENQLACKKYEYLCCPKNVSFLEHIGKHVDLLYRFSKDHNEFAIVLNC